MKISELPAVIVALRASRGWSQTELAERAGVSRNCIALIESRNERANSKVETLVKIFGAFDLEVKFEIRERNVPDTVKPTRRSGKSRTSKTKKT
jgi:transcriptional regulator with XRE-family HTH domain